MDSRRRNGLIALAALLAVAAVLIYFQSRSTPGGPTTAFAPAESADESVAPPDPPIDPPTGVAMAPAAGEAEGQATEPTADPGDTLAGAASEAAAPQPEAATGAPEADVAMTEPLPGPASGGSTPDAVTPPLAVPTFDIVRVEPSGDTVIAGQAEPNALIEIMDGPEVIASTEASDAGEWAIALEEPLDPGTHDLAISTTSPDQSVVTLSDERVTVSVPEDGSEDVLVVLNAPDAPSAVLQVPAAEEEAALAEPPGLSTEGDGAPAAAPEQEIASAPEPEQSEAETPTAAQAPAEATVTEAPAPSADETAIASEATSEGVTAEVPAEETSAGETEIAVAPPAQPPPADAPAGPEVVASSETPVEQDVALAPSAGEVEEPGPGPAEAPAVGETTAETPLTVEQPAEPEPEIVANAPVDVEPAPPPPVPAVVVAAVEADTDGSLYVAGTAASGETVRVYLDGEYVGDATPSPSGTWLIETVIDLPAGEYLVRADQVGSDGAVVARYEVPFDREVEVAVLKPTGVAASTGAATVAGAMPEMETVIIKRGDNLWRIARATWGKGVRWSTIYQANTDQIQNPNRIYPGQVFVMPKGDATWQN